MKKIQEQQISMILSELQECNIPVQSFIKIQNTFTSLPQVVHIPEEKEGKVKTKKQ